MASGPAGRVRARLGAFVLFPFMALAAMRRRSGVVAVPTTNPFFLPGFMVATRALHRKPVVALVYDLWPDAAEVSGGLDTDSRLRWLAVRFNEWWLHRADGVVFIGRHMANQVGERYGYIARSTIIETGADLEEFLNAVDEAGTTLLDHWFDGGLVASYVGNMGMMHDIETLAQAGILLGQRASGDVRLFIAASGPGVAQLRSGWAATEVPVRFEEPLSDDLWRRALLRSDVALVTLRAEAAHTSLPSKTFSAMAAGCAIVAVAPETSDLAEAVRGAGAGLVIAPGDSVGLAEALVSYERDEDLLRQHQTAARRAAEHLYDMPALAARWDEFLSVLDR